MWNTYVDPAAGRPTSRRRIPIFRWAACLPIALAGCLPDGFNPLCLLGLCGNGSSVRVSIQMIGEGLTAPVALADPNDGTGRLFIADQPGRVRVLLSNGTFAPTPLLDLVGRVVNLNPFYDERGLLGLALHPNFAANRRFFVAYNSEKKPGDPDTVESYVRLSEFLLSAGDSSLADMASERILLEIAKPQANHNGGQVAFGPDGFLYLSIGDGGGGNDTSAGHTPGLGNAEPW